MRTRRSPLIAVAILAAVAAGCSGGSDGKLDTRAEYVDKTVAAMKARLRDDAAGHERAIEDYANCMYDVIEAHRDELEAVKDSDSEVQKILATNDDDCQDALQEEIGK